MTPEQEALILAYLAAQQQLADDLLGYILPTFSSLPTYHRDDADSFASLIVPILAGAQQASRYLTLSYLEELHFQMTGEMPNPSQEPRDQEVNYRKGVDPEEVYHRPFRQIWTDLQKGKDLDESIEKATKRLENTVKTDLQLAKTHAARDFIQEQGSIQGYRRVLTGAENCGLCIVASTQRYHIEDLMPIHPGCDCAVAPILGTQDPGQTINSAMLTDESIAEAETKTGVKIYNQNSILDVGDLLEPVHDEMETRFGVSDRGARAIDYRKVLMVHEHGEMGPLLTIKSHDFTGPGSVN